MVEDYSKIQDPYTNYLDKDLSEESVDNGNVMEQAVKSSGDMGDIWTKTFIRSENWSPKKVGFYLDGQTGYAEFVNVYISGNIQAVTGTIGGFTINATNLSVTAGGNTVTISSGATAFLAGPTGSPTVTITQAGALTASNATISGSITATSGSIGSFTIGTYLYTGSKTAYNDSNSGVHLGGDGIGIGNNVFTVSSTGALVATSATISGSITATSGTIGGWTISSTTLTGGGVTLNSSTGAISGATITGSTLTTANSGQRVVLTSTLAQFYNSSGIEIVDTYASGSSYLIKGIQTTSSIALDPGSSGAIILQNNGTSKVICTSTVFGPFTNNNMDLGGAGVNWKDFYLINQFNYNGIVQPLIYVGYVSGTSITQDNTSWSVTNPSTGRYTVTHGLGTTDYTVNVTVFNSITRAITVDGLGSTTFQVRIATLGVPSTTTDPALINSDFMFSLFLNR